MRCRILCPVVVALAVVLVAAQALLLLVSGYHSAITILGTLHRPVRVRGVEPSIRFALFVCARNEAAVIARIVTGLLRQDYPADRFRVVVVAHNCTDRTASVAREAGAEVVELNDGRSGKVVALRAGLALMGEGFDFVGVFDADSLVPRDLLRRVADRAGNEDCLQVETLPPRAQGSVAAALGFARRARAWLWWRPRDNIGLGALMSGSGCFMRGELLLQVSRDLRTVTEDLEMSARVYASGRRVAYVSETALAVEEPATLGASVRQRTRWVRGHLGVVRWELPSLLRRTLHGDIRAFDIAVCLVMPSRVVTRMGMAGALALALSVPALALPWPVFAFFLGAEWLLPLGVASRNSLAGGWWRGAWLIIGSATLELLWFPIGLWALLTPRARAWRPVARSIDREAPDAAITG